MKIRRDVVFASAVLFTVALLCALPTFTRTALEGYSSMSETHQLCCGLYLRTMGDLGVASLAIIFIALIVTWAGYAKGLRSAWFIMFAVVWIWAFPLLALPLPLFKRASALTFVEVLYGALHGYQYPRILVKAILIFSLMVIALLLPIKSFFVSRGIREPSRSLSPRLIGFSVAGALVIAIALLAWIDFRAYEIPSAWLNNGQQLVGIDTPLSPPPPSRARAPAEDWLSLSADAKQSYVHGYLFGFLGGKREGCSFYEEKSIAYLPHQQVQPAKQPAQVCLTSLPYLVDLYSNVYADKITGYYTKYPRDREAKVSNILDVMATPPGLTNIDQIHAKLTGGEKVN
jgi:hypothetical protein